MAQSANRGTFGRYVETLTGHVSGEHGDACVFTRTLLGLVASCALVSLVWGF